MGVELKRPAHPNDEWRIAWNGRSVVAFAGPDAEERAELCYRQLIARLVPDEADQSGGQASAEPEKSPFGDGR
jgi:hypothetical protein